MAEWDAGGGWVRHGSERKGTVAASRQRSVDVLSGFRRKARRGFTGRARIDLSSARQASPNAFSGSAPAEWASWRISSTVRLREKYWSAMRLNRCSASASTGCEAVRRMRFVSA
mgnify:CR=1 FL=1